MASLRALVEQHREDIRAAAARHHGRRVRLYGSVARGQEREDSDIDLLVDFTPGSSLFDLMHLNRELEELLGNPVDVISRGGLKARDRVILDEAIEL
jgi:predicted nucleotidyltransferase